MNRLFNYFTSSCGSAAPSSVSASSHSNVEPQNDIIATPNDVEYQAAVLLIVYHLNGRCEHSGFKSAVEIAEEINILRIVVENRDLVILPSHLDMAFSRFNRFITNK